MASPLPSTAWFQRFLLAHPGGEMDVFDEWADGQSALREGGEMRRAVREIVVEQSGASDVLCTSFPQDDAAGASIFGRRGGEKPAWQRWNEEAAPEALRPGRKIGQFVLGRFLAKGGMGQVWEAEDTELRRNVALKLVLPDRVDEKSLALFAREARAGGRLSHPNLVTTLGFGTDEGLTWIAQELVEGSWTVKHSLDALRAEDTVPKDYYREAATLVARIADGMQAVHDAGVIHRDLKPQNILMTEEDQPKVTDFGLARVADDSFLSETGDFGGTWAYMSPEQVTAKRMGLDHRTDVFSLGIVLYELLTLRRPFEGDTTQQVAAQIIAVEPPNASKVRSQCPRELAVICGKALEKLPDRRYGSMAELAADLRRHLANEPILAKPPGPVIRGMKWARRHPAVSSAGVIASVALVVVSALSLNLAARTKELTNTTEDLREQTQIAQSSEAIATQRANDILSLSASKDLEDLIAQAEGLWPANPEMIGRYERWLADAQVLLDGRQADGAAEIPGRPSLADHKAKLDELVARSEPQTDERRLAQAREHESYPALKQARGELTWRRRMLGQLEWPDPVAIEQAVEVESLPVDGIALYSLAYGMVGPEAEDLDQVTRGWVLSGRALDQVEDMVYPAALMTMAWGQARLGLLEAARASAVRAVAKQTALDEQATGEAGADLAEVSIAAAEGSGAERSKAAPDSQPHRDSEALVRLKDEMKVLKDFLALWKEPAREARSAELRQLKALISALEIEVGERVLADPQDGWWQRQLAALVAGIEALHAPQTGLAGDALAEPFGWGVAKRAAFARESAERLEGAEGAQRWADAIAAIEASEPYGGLTISPQMGLLPIGADLESGLWEFAHLATGEPVVRGGDGKLLLTEETGLVFVLIPGGRFLMGAQNSDPTGVNYDPQAKSNEGPVHPVTLSPYFLSKYEMTQGQWKRSTAANPSLYENNVVAPTLLHPVEQVTWTECMGLMARLELELPSEAQWENGCRGGTSTPWWFGPEREAMRGKVNLADKTAAEMGAFWESIQDWPEHEDGAAVHAEVGLYPANNLGLHEVHGNVFEWCRDGYDPDAYDANDRADPVVPWTGSANRMVRGGGFDDATRSARSALRDYHAPGYRFPSIGLRPARGVTTDDFATSPRQAR